MKKIKSPIIPFLLGAPWGYKGDEDKKAFTLVELIVVITILAILGTIGFISFQNYNSYARDTIRTSDLSLISRWIKISQVQWGYAPKPENFVEITASGTIIWYQWEFTSKIGNKYKLNWDFKDPLDEQNYVYSVDKNLNNFTVWGFLENDEVALSTEGFNPLENTYAREWRTLKTKWDKFWIILKDWENLTWTVDIVTTTENYEIYFDDDEKIEWPWTILWKMIPNSSCARIQWLWNFRRKWTDEKWGKYEIINSQWKNITVYCDYNNMEWYLYSAIEDWDMEVGESEQWKNYTKIKDPLEAHSWEHLLKVVWARDVNSDFFIYIDPTKKYKLEWWAKSLWVINSRFLFGFKEYDENFELIANRNVNVVLWTEAILLNDVNPDDTTITFSNSWTTCSKWENWNHFLNFASIAFNIDDSWKYNDLPNYNLSPRKWFSSIVYNWNSCTLNLNEPVWLSYLSGTKIRMHSAWWYNYIATNWSVYPPNIWTKYSWEIRGISESWGNRSYFKRWTKYIKIMILANWWQTNNEILYIDDLKLIEK